MNLSNAKRMKDENPNKYKQLVENPTAEKKVLDSIKIGILLYCCYIDGNVLKIKLFST